MRFLLALLFFFCGTTFVQASAVQKVGSDTALIQKQSVLQTDQSRIDVRKFDQKAIDELRKQNAFIYDDVAPEGLSWWQRFFGWLAYIFNRIFGGSSTTDTGFVRILFAFLKWFLIFLAVAIIVFIVIKLIGLDLKFLTGKSKHIDVPYEESLENIHEIDFDDQLDVALQNGNYRLAVRLLYLRTLKHLSDRGLINWQLEKTNQTYALEIENEDSKKEFAKLTNKFEYIWYGEFFIDKSSFEPINESFSQFNSQTK